MNNLQLEIPISITNCRTESWAPRSSLNCHSERPKHLSWSPDGSLLALTLMKYVALLNPSTNSTLERLNSPESGSIASSHFLGSSARYLVAAGVWDLVLWDLITRSGTQGVHISAEKILNIRQFIGIIVPNRQFK